MITLVIRVAVALVTFVFGVFASRLFSSPSPGPRAVAPPTPVIVEAPPAKKSCRDDPIVKGFETAERKAVRLAEEFVARNGYTDLPADRSALSYESVERSDSAEEILDARRDTLERRAYGIRYMGRTDRRGWMIAFRFKGGSAGSPFGEAGRVVTMDEDFGNVRVEHKMFPLANVHKKF